MAVNSSSSSSSPPDQYSAIITTTTTTPLSENNEENRNGFNYKKGVKNLIETAPEMKKLPPEFVLKLPRNPLSASNAEIPVIDLSGLVNGSPVECRVSTVQAISSASALWGFFRIVNHGIEARLIEEMVEEVEAFFSLSSEEKMRYASEDVMSPVRYGTSLNSSSKHALHWRDYLRHYGHPFQNSFHLWPNNPTKYRNVAKKYLTEIWQLAMRIIGAISEGLGLEPNYIENSLGEGCQILAANYYPPCPEPDKTLGLAPHSDHGALTILMQNGVNGLQVKHNDTWIVVPHVPNSFVVNLGDFLEILSNGKYKSVEHRAVVNAQKTRISLAVGHGPQQSTVIGPASPLIKENEEVQYRPITYKDYIRLQQSSTIRGKTALHALMTKT
ncbi:hypothetical protein RD792_006193 [Penstemon davidsonii]|uniref:Fe2OG dioxygenase domain-containing protein n=1 Tax=Penstemon davidsonii TaxID=160366 RepID=A0ABR0DC96_9LAMI|nr:hypothetical protein RD792_006193 [Penstemon davidsonii]